MDWVADLTGLGLGVAGLVAGEVRARRADASADRRAKEQREHDRELRRGELQIEHKASAYAALISVSEGLIGGLHDTYNPETKRIRPVGTPTSISPEALHAMRVPMMMWASPSVREAYNALWDGMKPVVARYQELLDDEEADASDYEQLLSGLNPLGNALVQAVREDLDATL